MPVGDFARAFPGMSPRQLLLATVAGSILAALFSVQTALAELPAPGKPERTHRSPAVSSPRAAPPSELSMASPECPRDLGCRFAAAAYEQNDPDDPGDYGNYDLAKRPADGLGIRYIVIHDAEGRYGSTIDWFQNPKAYASAHYVIRSSDGEVTQMVSSNDVAWHAGNWWMNSHAIGIELEGHALEGNTWYTDRLYESLAELVRYLTDRYDIPLDRAHVIGHDEVPGPTAAEQPEQHWDPGPFFNWDRLMARAGAERIPSDADPRGRIVTIAPGFGANRPAVSACDQTECRTLPSQPANFVYLHTEPSSESALVADPLLAGTSLEPDGVGTTQANDWGDKAVSGQTFALADRSGDWTAIWYGTQKAWFYDPGGGNSIPGNGTLITPRADRASVPVYGRAYPDGVEAGTLGYAIPAGQRYVARGPIRADYYSAQTVNAPETYEVIQDETEYYEISLNHRLGFVKASDVRVVSHRAPPSPPAPCTVTAKRADDVRPIRPCAQASPPQP